MNLGTSPRAPRPGRPVQRRRRRSFVEAWRGGFWGEVARREIGEIRRGLDDHGEHLPPGARTVVDQLLDVYIAVIDTVEGTRLPSGVRGRRITGEVVDREKTLNSRTLRPHEYGWGPPLPAGQLSWRLRMESCFADRLATRVGVTLSADELATALWHRYPPPDYLAHCFD